MAAEAMATERLSHDKGTDSPTLVPTDRNHHRHKNGLKDFNSGTETLGKDLSLLVNGCGRSGVCNGGMQGREETISNGECLDVVSGGASQLTSVETDVHAVKGKSTAGEGGYAIIDTFIQSFHDKVDKESLTEEALKFLSLIPDGYIPLPHQVGGHRHVDGKLGMLHSTDSADTLFKPVLGVKGPREVLFYKNIFQSLADHVPKEVTALQELVPKFYGTRDIVDKSGETCKYMMLEDIVSRFQKPCVMDIKIGSRRRLGNRAEERIAPHKRCPFQEMNFFRIIGMRVYKSKTGNYDYYDSTYGRRVSVNGGRDALELFFKDGESKRDHVIEPIIERLYKFLRWFEEQTYFKIYSSSVIIVYEGSTDNIHTTKLNDLLDIRLVDFGRTYDCSVVEWCDYDKDTLIGLRNLIKFLEELRTNSILPFPAGR